MEAPLSLESQHPKLSLEKSGGRFFLRSNSEDVSDSNSPPPTPTAQITSFFNSAVNSAAQALRKQPSKANSLGFSSTPSPSASGLTTPMTLTPTKHPVHPQYHPPQQQQHHQQHLQNFHHQGEGQDGDFCVSPPDLFPLRPLGQSRGFDGVTSPVSGRDTVDGGFAKPQLMTSPSAPYSPAHQPSNPNSSSNGSSFSPQDAHFGAQNPPPTFVGESTPFTDDLYNTSIHPFSRPSALTSTTDAAPNSAPPFASASPPTTPPRDATSSAVLIDVKSVPLSSTPPTRTNDSAYGSGVGPTGLVANAVVGRKNDSKSASTRSHGTGGGGDNDDDYDDDISDVVVHDDAEFYYGVHHDEDDDDEDREAEHYDPLLLKSAGDDVFVRKSAEGLLLGRSGGGGSGDASPPV